MTHSIFRTGVRFLLVPACLSALISRASHSQAPGDAPAQQFILDYDVPESPGFVAVGETPTNVLRASAAKPVVASVLNGLLTGEKAQSGIALDFAPYLLAGGRLQSVTEYRTNLVKRLLANTLLSVATVTDQVDPLALRFGTGIRMTLWDSHDLLQDAVLGQAIDEALMAAATAPDPFDVADDEIDEVTVPLSDIYEQARNRARRTPGSAASIGYATSGLLRSSVLSADSVEEVRHQVWGSYRYTFGSSYDIMGLVHAKDLGGDGSTLRVGTGVRVNASGYSFSGELVYDSDATRLLPGASAEIRALPRIHLIASLVNTVDTVSEGGQSNRVRLRVNVRWNMSEME